MPQVQFTSNASGAWANNASWLQDGAPASRTPTAADATTIVSPHTITSTGFTLDNAQGTLTIANGATLAVNGTIACSAGSITNNGTINGPFGLTLSGGWFSNNGTLGAASVGSIAISGNSTLVLSAGSTVSVSTITTTGYG